MTADDLYDFEGNIPDTVALAFTAAQLNVWTLNNAPSDQKQRPRSELTFHPTGSISPPRIMLIRPGPAGTTRAIGAYTGELMIKSITGADGDSNATHRAYRARIRQIMELDTLRAAVNLVDSPYWIDFVIPTGSSVIDKTEDGFQVGSLTYNLQFSIKQDAFNQLAAAN